MKVLDRKQTAKLCKISVRTVDRYLRMGKLRSQDIGGRIFVTVKSIEALSGVKIESHTDIQSTEHHAQAWASAKLENQSHDHQSHDYQSHNPPSSEAGSEKADEKQAPKPSVYKKLYEELQHELKEKQERLEGANYRVGQLEGMLKESVPLLEYKKAIALEGEKRLELEQSLTAFEKSTAHLQASLEDRQNEIKQIAKRLKEEKVNKTVFLIILILLFMLQPLWLIFPPVTG